MDTTQWLILSAAVIIALILIIWLASNSKRRKLQEQRSQAAAIRSRADELRPTVQETQDRASVTGQIAEDARAEAQAKAQEAARLEAEAHEHRVAAEQAREEYVSELREADRLDPDVKTDDDGFRLDADGNRVQPDEVPAARAGSGPFAGAAIHEDEDEEDLADAEDPFGHRDDAEVEEETSGSTRWEPTHEDLAPEFSDAEQSRPEFSDAEQGRPEFSDAEQGRPEFSDAEQSRPAPEVTLDEDDDDGIVQAVPAGAEAPLDPDPFELDQDEPEPQQHQRREFSEPDEVRDGGYGMGSAAPIHDGAQPFGHAVKAWNDTRTFLEPGSHGYEGVAPDVWFYDAQAAQAAGFARAGD